MSNSSLVTYTNLTKNRTAPRNHKIDTITIHCYVGQVTAKTGCDYFATTDRQVSSNYVIGYDGSIGLSVEEKNRSWCSGGYDKNGKPIVTNGMTGGDNDHRAITIEVACEPKHPYVVTDEAMESLIKLCIDICKRNNIKELKWKGDKKLVGKINEQNMTVHRWFANKACPGDYLYGKHPYIASEVNKALNVPKPTPKPIPSGEIKNGTKLVLKDVALYGSSSATKATKNISGAYFVWNDEVFNNKIRVTNAAERVGVSGQVTGWIAYTDAKNAVGGESKPTPKPTPKPVPKPTPKPVVKEFKKGDYVKFAGGKHYVASQSDTGFNVKASRAYVINVAKGAKHPYCIRAVNSGNHWTAGVYGWVDANTVSDDSSTPTNNVVTIKNGTKLNLKNVALYGSSSSKSKSSTKTGVYYIWNTAVINDKVRITNAPSRVGKAGQITGWISYADAKKYAVK